MLLQHRNHWLDLIKEAGFDPALFSVHTQRDPTGPFTVLEDDRIFVIQVPDSPLEFYIRQTPDDFDTFTTNNTEYKPGYPMRITRDDFFQGHSVYPLRNVDAQLREWLQNVVRRYLLEKSSDDLWAHLAQLGLQPAAASIPPADLEHFSQTEKQQISAGLGDFKRLVAEQVDPLKVQLATLNERIDYLVDRLDKLNRFDWKAQAFSTIVSIAVNLAVDTQTGKQLVTLFQQALHFIAGLLPPGLHP